MSDYAEKILPTRNLMGRLVLTSLSLRANHIARNYGLALR